MDRASMTRGYYRTLRRTEVLNDEADEHLRKGRSWEAKRAAIEALLRIKNYEFLCDHGQRK